MKRGFLVLAFVLMGLSCLTASAQIRPAARTVTVVGAVKKPGIYPMRDRGLTLMQVIGMSEGFLPTANKSEVRIVRLQQQGAADNLFETIVNLKNIEVGKAPDVQLQSGDVILIPTHVKPERPPRPAPPEKDIARVL